MTLVLDRRGSIPSGQPALHAFLCGVSRYVHLPGGGGEPADKTFGLTQLTATATTAYRIYQWLLAADAAGRLPQPLATVHLLLSPSDAELTALPEMAEIEGTKVSPATRRELVRAARAWREMASGLEASRTWFYFAGHGVQRKKQDAVLLLEDFGDPLAGGSLTNTVDAQHLVAGMAPPRNPARKIAQQQLYFLDACRMAPAEFRSEEWKTVPDLWDVELSGRDDRAFPIFYASVPGSQAFAVGGGQTLFSTALLDCLDRLGSRAPALGEEDPRSRVTTLSLMPALRTELARLNALHGSDQELATGGQLQDIPLVFLDEPPEVEVSFSLDPADQALAAVPHLEVRVRDDRGQVLPLGDPFPAHPWELRLREGIYAFQAEPRGTPPMTLAAAERLMMVRLPRSPVSLKVTP